MFGKNLKLLRLEKGLTQAQLAKEIGVSQGTIYFWENEINEPTASYLVKLSKFFNITVDELLDIPFPTENNSEFLDYIVSYNSLSEKEKKLLKGFLELIKTLK